MHQHQYHYYKASSLERSPSQPSLSFTVKSENSEDIIGTPTGAFYFGRGPMTPPVSQKDLAAFAGGSLRGSPKRGVNGYSSPPTPESIASESLPVSPDVEPTFTDRRAKRLSLSRSMQNLREKADKARRRSSVSSEKMAAPSFSAADLPPVPALPAMYRPGHLQTSPVDPRRTASDTAALQMLAQKQMPTSTPPSAWRPPADSPRPQHRKVPSSSSGGLGAFFRKLTGRSKAKEERSSFVAPAPTYRPPPSPPRSAPRPSISTPSHSRQGPHLASESRPSISIPSIPRHVPSSAKSETSHRPSPALLTAVPKVNSPSSAPADFAEQGVGSISERRQTYRKSLIKRVPVPTYDAEQDVLVPKRRSSEKSKEEAPPMPENALFARAAALAALNGGPSDQLLRPSPTASVGPTTPSDDGEKLPPVSPAYPEEPIIRMVPASPPMVTHVVVTEPEQLPEPTANADDEPAPISPRKQSVTIIPSRSQSGSSRGSAGLPRMSKSAHKLSDFGTYDSSDGSDECADVVRPLELRIPPRAISIPSPDGNVSPRTPRTPLSPYLPVTPEDGVSSPTTPAFPKGEAPSVATVAREFGGFTDGPELGRTVTSGSSRSNTSQANGSGYAHSPTSPTSMYGYSQSYSSHSSRDPRFAGSMAAHEAPVGDGLGSEGHGRTSFSSGRLRSVVANHTIGRRISQKAKEPPTSHDAYMQKQAEMLARRQSCKPMIHSRASIAAELTEVRDKECSDVMETFFMS